MSPDGGTVYVTGDTSSALGQGAATFAYDAGTGKQLWVSRYHTKGAYLGAPAVSPDGATVYVAGTGRLSGRQSQFAVIAYAAATGQQRWLRYYSTVPGFAASAAVSPDGTTVYVTGDSVGSVLTVAYQATGNLEWATLYKNPYAGGAAGSQIEAGPGGNAVYVVGTASNKSAHSDIATFAYRAATGKCFWMDRYNARAGPFAGAIGVTPDGRTVVVTGSPNEGRTGGYAIAAYNASTGATRWTRRAPAAKDAPEVPSGPVIDPNGDTVFVVSSQYIAAWTVADGTLLWTTRYAPAKVHPAAIALSGDGTRLFVSGSGRNGGTGGRPQATSHEAPSQGQVRAGAKPR